MSIPLPILANTRIHNNATASASPFGAPDGVTSVYSLVDRYGFPIKANANVTAIHRTDWQGRQVLYATARRQWLRSTIIDTSGAFWTKDGAALLTVTTNAAVDPLGGTTMTRMVSTASAGTAPGGLRSVSMGSIDISIPRYVSAVVRRDGYRYVSFYGWGEGNGSAHDVIDGTANLLSWSACGTDILSADFVRVWAITPSPSGATSVIYGLRMANSLTGATAGANLVSGSTIDVWMPQVFYASEQGVVIPNDGVMFSPTTVTDYTYTSAGVVTLGQVPLSTATLDWDGTGLSVG